MTDDELDKWVFDLLGQDADSSDSNDDESIEDLVAQLLEKGDDGKYDQKKLLRVLDENNTLRDECFYTPETILVYTEKTETLEAVPLWELPLLYPLKGRGARWGYSDLGEITEQKSVLYRQSKVANELAEEEPTARPECGTVCLIVPEQAGVLSWCVVKARIAPELNR